MKSWIMEKAFKASSSSLNGKVTETEFRSKFKFHLEGKQVNFYSDGVGNLRSSFFIERLMA